ncbi:FkbM family methyltransferase [Flavihumibacter stibioxidans]|uniref:Methyltransferase FkbM domain-containing protein n=1 Tax=Flavihumibacter stibioxidans TaxID=1834163 RepID=A0ABR7M582_9BACT|nr:FkbM family methyltransferase [Flavihumibacter stibioxidans]MBC6490132.1 hypothetical protein [Flavihumibacter stibioxidans]
MKLPDLLDKLFFCAKISAGIPSFFSLLYRTKMYSHNRNSDTVDKSLSATYLLNLPAGPADIVLRNYSGDIDMFYEVFWRRNYALPVDIGKVVNIVDLGSNIGMTIQWWAGLFPAAAILGVEPDPANFELLQQNTHNLPGCTPVWAAIGNSDGNASIRRSRYAYNSVVDDRGEIKVNQISMPTLMAQYRLSSIDLLKIDIEGSEKFLLDSDTSWLFEVKYIVAEIHEGCEHVIDIIRAHGFQFIRRTGFDSGLYFFSRVPVGL